MFLFLFFALPTFPILSATSKVDTNSVRHYLRRFFKLPTPIVLWHGMGKLFFFFFLKLFDTVSKTIYSI